MNVHPACGHSLIEVFIHPNQITGMGLVIGLAGTGGDRHATKQFALNLLQKMGNRVDPQLRDNILRFQEKTDNMSAVPAVAGSSIKSGQIDIGVRKHL